MSARTLGRLIAAAMVGFFSIHAHMASAEAAAPIHVCGTVTDYFVSDIASGGRIEIDGKNYPIASSASNTRTKPLPMVDVGSAICLDGTLDDQGTLLDFAVVPRTSGSASPPTETTYRPES
jgi:hypothetical protein